MNNKQIEKRLVELCKSKYDSLSGGVLDIIELLIPSDDGRYDKARERILDLVNSAFRGLKDEIIQSFTVSSKVTERVTFEQRKIGEPT